jgi:adenosylcobinamide kinase/adenosylcobinamide-phosphate guanylyltransferase
MTTENIQFVLGGARSGKSEFAEKLALASFAAMPANSARLVYLATAEAFDDEMQTRIDLHKARRSADWQLCDAPIDLPAMIRAHDGKDTTLLVDCTSVWITNLLINGKDIQLYRDDFIDALGTASGKIIVVASETGLGIVPDNKLSRQFRDANGKTNQAIAQIADCVFFLVAGIVQKIKSAEN